MQGKLQKGCLDTTMHYDSMRKLYVKQIIHLDRSPPPPDDEALDFSLSSLLVNPVLSLYNIEKKLVVVSCNGTKTGLIYSELAAFNCMMNCRGANV